MTLVHAGARARHSCSAAAILATLAGSLLVSTASTAASRHPMPSPDAHQADLAAAHADAERRKTLAQTGGADFKGDDVPPVLNNIRVTGSVDAQLPNQSVDVSVKLTDDYSGVVSYSAYFMSPSGQVVSVSKVMPVPAKAVSETLAAGPLWRGNSFTILSEPGVWRAVDFYSYDAHGNYVFLSESDLAKLGKPSFIVRNAGGYDATAPNLSHGTLLSGAVKLSKPARGTWPDSGPYVDATLDLTDAGNGALAGAAAVTMVMCYQDGRGDCYDSFSMTGYADGPGKAATSIHVGTQLDRDQMPGTYEIESVYVRDYAGNSRTRRNWDFPNGDTDFRAYFPVTTMTVEP